MKTIKRSLAAAELLLLFPAALFMTSLVVRQFEPAQYEPARTAQQIVAWYAARPRIGLWLLLIALPLTVLATGCATLLPVWRGNAELRNGTRQSLAALRANLATCIVALATLAAAAILAIVALHVLTN
jgi:sterol desaturase/sphingolipid hydroxylase (fatty acid hydroxylase superfamily)